MAGENIAALKELLQRMGFENGLEGALRAKACFLPPHFEVFHKIDKPGDACSFLLHVVINEAGVYQCRYYDACYRKEIIIDDEMAASLETRMKVIDWQADFDEIESVMLDLSTLAGSDLRLANLLQFKCWVDTPLENRVPDITAFRVQHEITQRFYVVEGSAPISVDEAFRFLQSRWLEKQARKKNGTAKAPTIAPKAHKATKKTKH